VSRDARGGVILCGGRSSRMGRPKHLLSINGRTFLECCVEALQSVVDRVVISVGPGQRLSALGSQVSIVEDQRPSDGPLAGIAAAIETLNSEVIAVVTCDAPLLKPAVLQLLFDRIGGNDAALVTAFGRVQFFPGVFSRRVGGLADDLLHGGERRMSALVDRLESTVAMEKDVLAVDPLLDSFFNVNTPADYAELLRRIGRD
jgi:molybdopterin-guanine dinucleotide biosynthesis protein A